MKQITFAMIKPDAVAARNTGNIIKMIEDHGFEIVRMLKGRLHEKDAETFYAVHKDKPFFGELVKFVTSGPIVIMALEKENAIADWRALMGATDPRKAEAGTVRHTYATDISNNAVHGSDAPETAIQELSLFFPELAQ